VKATHQLRYPNCNVDIYQTRKLTIMGIKSIKIAFIAFRKTAKKIKDKLKLNEITQIDNVKITDIHGNAKMSNRLNLEGIHDKYPNKSDLDYELNDWLGMSLLKNFKFRFFVSFHNFRIYFQLFCLIITSDIEKLLCLTQYI